ncbi:MAG: acyl-CoA dehydrogenase family protein, partial [Cyanobacteria bacterium P01_G01_bin.38]
MVNTINLQKIDVQDYQAVAAKVGQQLAVNAVQQDLEAGIPSIEVDTLKHTGLLLLPIPREYGGAGAKFPDVYQVVKTLAKAQGSVGQLYANHATLVHAAAAIGRPGQAEHYYRLTTEQNLFWANALNARDARLKIEPEGNNFRVNGIKSFGTGVAAADMNAIAALQGDQPRVFILPKDRPGIRYNHDWNNLGQRR